MIQTEMTKPSQVTLWQVASDDTDYEKSKPMIDNIDCRLGLLNIADKSVSLILTDPPYFIDGMGDGWNTEKLKKRVKPGVVGSMPAGMKFSTQQGKDLQQFLYPIAVEWLRVLRPGGFCLLFSQNRLAHRAGIALEDAGFEIRDVLLWRYEGQAKAFTQEHFVRKSDLSEQEKDRLIRKLGGRKTPQLKPQGEMIILAQAPREGTFVENWDKWETGLIDVNDPYINKDKFPGTVIATKKPKRQFGHMTEKPVDLLRHLIRIFSAPNSLVLDPFAGSGSTGVAALMESRTFQGFEIEEEMAAIANSRISKALSDD
ncbi:MAG: site-specific DNA-methyltransferase [Chloroflexi bacterium]|nr:site-specific DNA-methyltransferase [Chloroflexota bacterium]MCY3976547.1 site-specific DNA-methyltransferase [Chloroflexota bacterium]